MVATTLLRFFYRDETAKIWFRNSSAFNCDRCNDGVQDYGETGVDCGGPCPPCPSSIILNRLGQFAKEEMKLYPNPATTQVTIELPWFMDETDRVKLRVFDIYGKLAKVIDVTSSTHTFSTADLKNGSYLYDVISSEEKLFSGQFMVVKSH